MCLNRAAMSVRRYSQPWSMGGQPAWPGRVVSADLDVGQDRGDEVVPEGDQRRYGPGGRAGQIVAACARGFGHELLGAEFAQIVHGLAGVVGGQHGSTRSWRGLWRSTGYGEPAGRRGEGEHGRQRGADPGLVHIDAADPAGAHLCGQRQPIQRAAGEEADIDAGQGGANRWHVSASRATISGKRSTTQPQPSCLVLQLIASNRRTRAFGVALECQQPEADFEHRQVPSRCLECDPTRGEGAVPYLRGRRRPRTRSARLGCKAWTGSGPAWR